MSGAARLTAEQEERLVILHRAVKLGYLQVMVERWQLYVFSHRYIK